MASRDRRAGVLPRESPRTTGCSTTRFGRWPARAGVASAMWRARKAAARVNRPSGRFATGQLQASSDGWGASLPRLLRERCIVEAEVTVEPFGASSSVAREGRELTVLLFGAGATGRPRRLRTQRSCSFGSGRCCVASSRIKPMGGTSAPFPATGMDETDSSGEQSLEVDALQRSRTPSGGTRAAEGTARGHRPR